MATVYNQSKLGIKDITIPVGSNVIFNCSMHSKIWMAHLLYWVGIRDSNQALNQFIDSYTDLRIPGTIAQYWKYTPSHLDPFLLVDDMEDFISSNIGTSRFVHMNSDNGIPPTMSRNVCLEVTLENYNVIATQYGFLARGLKVGDRFMVYQNSFKNENLRHSFYTKSVANYNLCAGCKKVKQIHRENRAQNAHREYMEAEDAKMQQILKTTDKVLARSFKVLHRIDIEWKPDSSAKACTVCQDAFSFFNRRHHCRRCGDIVCGSCSAISSKKGMNVLKDMYTFDIVTVRLCKYCCVQPQLYCNNAVQSEKTKWVYKGK